MNVAKKETEFVKPPTAGGGPVASVRRSTVHLATDHKKRDIDAFTAGEACALFGTRIGKGGGAGFARWCAENGIEDIPRQAAEWEPHLKAFAERPIHGHRRKTE
jgi:hypothetical protein